MTRLSRNRSVLSAALLTALLAAGCSREPPPPAKSPETVAVEEIAGDFLDYYEQVLRLSRRHVASPDSFQVAVAALPGSRLTDEQWEAWTAPYRAEPDRLAERLEKVIADLATVK